MKEKINYFIKNTENTKDDVEVASREIFVAEEVGQELLEIQEEKDELMTTLREKMSEVSNDDLNDGYIELEKDTKKLTQDESGNFFVIGKGGSRIGVSLGDVLASSSWGTNFQLSHTLEKSATKKIILNYYKNKIRDLYDSQIVLWGKEATVNSGGTSRAYEGIHEMEGKSMEDIPNGILAERILDSFFIRICNDLDDIPFEYQKADVYEDVENKTDFIFKIRKSKDNEVEKVVNVSEDTANDSVGIQFTTKSSEDALKQKQKQVQTVNKTGESGQEVVLVSLKMAEISQIMENYIDSTKDEKTKKTPDTYLSDEIKEKIFKAVLENLPKRMNIDADEIWENFKKDILEK